MKKVGIITIHKSPNYGACLQSFALFKYIHDLGHDCEIIDLYRPTHKEFIFSDKYKPYYENKISWLTKFKQRVKRYFNSTKSKSKIFDDFNKEIKKSAPFYSIEQLYNNPPFYDVYITGSDQVWNPHQPYCLEPFFLTFVKNTKSIKISYSSSIGVTSIEENIKNDFKLWLEQYDAISVRENQAKKLLESFIDKDIECVADPTFLLTPETWKDLAIYPENTSPYIFIFMLGNNENVKEYGKKIARECGKELIYMTSHSMPIINGKKNNVGPKEFLGLISKADMVITDSFHGTVFSILMGAKNFYTYIKPGNRRASRIEDLYSTFGLQNHILDPNLTDTMEELDNRMISLDKIREIIQRERTKSRNFLNRYL